MEALKKFALNASTSSLGEREQLFNDLFAVFESDAKNGKSILFFFLEFNTFLIDHLGIFLVKSVEKKKNYPKLPTSCSAK